MRNGALRPLGAATVALLCSLLLAAPARARATAGVTLAGTLKLATGEPLASVPVSIAETGAALTSLLTKTGADGTFSATVVPGTYAVTAYVSSRDGKPTDLVNPTVYGIAVEGDTSVAVVARAGTVVQACVVAADGRPLPGATVAVFDDLEQNTVSVTADASGWARFVMTAGDSALVIPPATVGREVARWLRFEELRVDDDGVAAPIVLGALAAPVDEGDGVVLLHRGAAPGRHATIALVSEGYTDGDEPFVDRNGNGVCDDEPYLDVNGNGRYDGGEPFFDANGDGRRTAEPFTDLNGDGVCNRGERELFLQNATDHVRMLLGFPVYREYAERIDVYAVFVASAQAGSDVVSIPHPVVRDTAFGSRFQSLNFIFDVNADAVLAAAAERVPDVDAVGLITYSVYGIGRETGGLIASLFGTRAPRLSQVSAHEFGHTIGHVGDEYYEYDNAPAYNGNEPAFPNLTRADAIGDLKWARFVLPATPLPTPDGVPGVGAFEGGYYHRVGVLRPAFSCLMRQFSIFCPVCAEAMLGQLARLSSATRPSAPALALPRDGDRVSTLFLASFDVDDTSRVASAQALVDGVPVGEPSRTSPFSVTLDARALATGRHDVAIEVTFVDGSRARTAAASVDAAPPALGPPPTLGTVRFLGGTIVLTGATGVAVPGSALFVDGADRFPLEAAPGGRLRVTKAALGSTSAIRIAKAVRKGRPVTLVVVEADGARSAAFSFTR